MDSNTLRVLTADIRMTHERFVKAMERRLPHLEPDTVERYFAVLSKLVLKLEDEAKPLRDVMQELIGEAAVIIMQELQGRRS